MRRSIRVLIPGVMCAAVLCAASEPVDLEAVNRIRDEGLHRSEVMDLAWHLTERIGPRLTASPELRKASAWARDTLASWGLEARLETFPNRRSASRKN